ncbi:MAG: aerial mycelium formation protein [Streptomycetales bacterium]
MIQPIPGGRRRIDRVLSDDYLAGMDRLGLLEVRALRDEARQEEADLSYVRRLLHARIDIVRAELRRRGAGAGGSVVDQLPEILADGPGRSAGSARHLTAGPSRVGEYRRSVEQLLADIGLSDVGARTDGELRQALDQLTEHERAVSKIRHDVQQVTDACNAEIARRYRDGEASVDDLLRGPS